MAFGTYKQDLEALTVTYSKKLVNRSYSYTSSFGNAGSIGTITKTINFVYEYHRYATRSYKYVGMSEEMAKNKLKSLIDTYNRQYWASWWNSSGANVGKFTDFVLGKKLQANIYAQRTKGCLYEVIVNINEDDTKFDVDGKTAPENLFKEENKRSYE